MGKPIASSIVSLTIVPAMLLSLAGPVLAQDDDVDALKAKIAALQGTVDNTMQGREYLYNELTAAIARAEAAEAERDQLQGQNADLSKSLRFMTDTRDHLYAEMDAAEKKTQRQLEVAENGQNFMTDRLSQVLEEKAASDAALKEQTALVQKMERQLGRPRLSGRTPEVNTGREISKRSGTNQRPE